MLRKHGKSKHHFMLRAVRGFACNSFMTHPKQHAGSERALDPITPPQGLLPGLFRASSCSSMHHPGAPSGLQCQRQVVFTVDFLNKTGLRETGASLALGKSAVGGDRCKLHAARCRVLHAIRCKNSVDSDDDTCNSRVLVEGL